MCSTLRFLPLLSLIGIFVPTTKADAEVTLSIHPLSTIILAPYDAYFGKASVEFDLAGWEHLTTAVSAFHGRKNGVEKTEFFYSSQTDTVDFTKDQVSLFLGKRFYNHPLYLQPTLNLGYYAYQDHARPADGLRNGFAGALLYVGAKFAPSQIEWGFDLGIGARLAGKSRFDVFESPVLLDGNATVGWRF